MKFILEIPDSTIEKLKEDIALDYTLGMVPEDDGVRPEDISMSDIIESISSAIYEGVKDLPNNSFAVAATNDSEFEVNLEHVEEKTK